MPARAPAIDLLAWPEIRAAEDRVRDANDAWREAARRYHYAPHGERDARQKALREATAADLRAGLELQRLRRNLAR